MADPNPLYIKQLGKLTETAMEIVAELHEMLDVVHCGEEDLDEIKELGLCFREASASDDLKKVAEIIATMEGNPLDVIVENYTRGHEELSKVDRINATFSVLFEIDPAIMQELNGIAGKDVSIDVELAEVELPDAADTIVAGRKVAVLIGKGKTELDHVQHVHVSFKRGVVEIGGGLEASNCLAYDPRKFCVHGNKGEVVDDLPDKRKLLHQVLFPHLPDLNAFFVRRHRHLSGMRACDMLRGVGRQIGEVP